MALGTYPHPRELDRSHFQMRQGSNKWHITPRGSFEYVPLCSGYVGGGEVREVTADTHTCAKCARLVPNGWFTR